MTGPVVGWREWAYFADVDRWIKVKVDTGARTSAMHASDIELFTKADEPWARFTITPKHHRRPPAVVEYPVVDDRLITSSNGETEHRTVVLAPIRIGDRSIDVELTLTTRHHMRFRMLLGRTALAGRFVVDPASSYLQGRPPRV